MREGQLRGGSVGSGGCFGGFELAKLVVEDLVQVGFEPFVGGIDFGTELSCVLGDLLRAAKILFYLTADAVGPVGEFRVDDFDLLLERGGDGSRGRRGGEAWLLVWLLRWLLGFLGTLLLLAFGLRFGLGPHLGDAAEEFFDFVFHDCTQ